MIKIERIGSRFCGVNEKGEMVPAGRTYKTRENLIKVLEGMGEGQRDLDQMWVSQ